MKFFKMDVVLSEDLPTTDIYLSEHAVLAIFSLTEGDAFNKGYRTVFITTTEKIYAVKAPVEDFLT